MAKKNFLTNCDCYPCTLRSCHLCLAIDKHSNYLPGRQISRCQDCGEEYCDACFHREAHDLCKPPPYDKPYGLFSLQSLMWNIDREDDTVCLSAEKYLKRAIELANSIKAAQGDQLDILLKEFTDEFILPPLYPKK